MKAAEKNVKRKAHYDHLEQSVDADAARRFHEPAAVKSKMTKLASVKIIEHYIEHTDDEDGEILEIIARKCMRGGDAGGDDRKRQEKRSSCEDTGNVNGGSRRSWKRSRDSGWIRCFHPWSMTGCRKAASSLICRIMW